MNILITGACGGMGKATTVLLKEKGHNVFAIDRKITDRVEGVNYFEADVTKQDELFGVFEAIKEKTDILDAILNFAGIYNLSVAVCPACLSRYSEIGVESRVGSVSCIKSIS